MTQRLHLVFGGELIRPPAPRSRTSMTSTSLGSSRTMPAPMTLGKMKHSARSITRICGTLSRICTVCATKKLQRPLPKSWG